MTVFVECLQFLHYIFLRNCKGELQIIYVFNCLIDNFVYYF